MARSPAHLAAGRRALWSAGALGTLLTAACSDNNVTNPPTFTPDAIVTADQLKAALIAAVGNPPFAGPLSGDPNYNGGLSVLETEARTTTSSTISRGA